MADYGYGILDVPHRVIVAPIWQLPSPANKSGLVNLLASGWTHDQIFANYPGVTVEDIRACLEYAKEILQQERVYPISDG